MVKLLIDTEAENPMDFKGELSCDEAATLLSIFSQVTTKMLNYMEKQGAFTLARVAKEGALAQELYGDDGKIAVVELEKVVRVGLDILSKTKKKRGGGE